MQQMFELFKNCRTCQIISALCFILFGLHTYQFIDSGFLIGPLLRMIFSLLFPIFLFFFTKKCIPWFLLVFGLAMVQQMDFKDYWEFMSVVMFTCYFPKMSIPTMIVYALDVLIVCTRHDKTPIHLAIHFFNCAFIYFVFHTFKQLIIEKALQSIKTPPATPLDLTESEAYILSELKAGKMQKEIEKYSENTVCKKLKECRIKNNCKTTDELLVRYIQQEKNQAS